MITGAFTLVEACCAKTQVEWKASVDTTNKVRRWRIQILQFAYFDLIFSLTFEDNCPQLIDIWNVKLAQK